MMWKGTNIVEFPCKVRSQTELTLVSPFPLKQKATPKWYTKIHGVMIQKATLRTISYAKICKLADPTLLKN